MDLFEIRNWFAHNLCDYPFLQALIQLGVAYYHLTNYNLRGFELLLKNARELLEPYSGEIYGVNVDLLKKEFENPNPDKIIEF